MALTPEEQAELERLRAELNAAPPKEEGFWSRYGSKQGYLDRLDSTIQGATSGWADEVTNVLPATAAWLGDKTGKSWGDIYGDITSAENARRDKLMQEHPVETLSHNMAGGALTMPFLPMPTRIADYGNKARMLVNALKESKLATKPLKAAIDTTQYLGKNAVSGAGYGAVAGAGYSDKESVDQAIEDTKEGAAFGVALPVAMNALKKPAGVIARAGNLKTPLGKGENFTNYSMATEPGESVVGDVYRNFINKMLGAQGTVARNDERFISPLKENVDVGKESLHQLKLSADRQADDVALQGIARDEQHAARLDAINANTRNEVARIKGDAETSIDDLNRNTRQYVDDLSRMTEGEAQKQAQMLERQTRELAMPNSMDDATRDLIAQADNGWDANALLKDWWNNNGFASVKERTFSWGSDLKSRLDSLVEADPALALKLGDVVRLVEEKAGRIQGGAVRQGMTPFTGQMGQGNMQQIDGAALMAIRNFFATASNKTSAVLDSGLLRSVAKEFDSFIRSELKNDPDALAQFNDHLARYGAKVTYGKVVTKDGSVTPSRWQDVVKSSPGADVGKGPLQREATNVVNETKAKKEQAAEAAKAAQQKAADEIRRLQREQQAAKDAVKAAADAEKSVLRRTRARQNKEEKVSARQKYRDERIAAEARLKEATAAYKAAKAKQAHPQSIFSANAYLQTLGPGAALTGLGVATGNPLLTLAAIPASALAAKGLVSQTGQRFAAGQTSLQQWAQNLNASEQGRIVAKALRDGVTVEEVLRRQQEQEKE